MNSFCYYTNMIEHILNLMFREHVFLLRHIDRKHLHLYTTKHVYSRF